MSKIREHRDKLVIGNKLGRQIYELSQLTPWKVKVYHGISSLLTYIPYLLGRFASSKYPCNCDIGLDRLSLAS